MSLHQTFQKILGIVQAIHKQGDNLMADFTAMQTAEARLEAAVAAATKKITDLEAQVAQLTAELTGSATAGQPTIDAETQALNTQAAALEAAAATPPPAA